MRKIIEFEGLISGDGECFCFNVDRETFIRLMGEEPSIYDYSEFDLNDNGNIVPKGNKFRVYPGAIFGYDKEKKKIKIEIE